MTNESPEQAEKRGKRAGFFYALTFVAGLFAGGYLGLNLEEMLEDYIAE